MRSTIDREKLPGQLMSTPRTHLFALPFTASVFAALLASCDQPKPFCIVSPQPFAVKLIEKGREGACDDFGPASFNADPEVGLAPYYARDGKGQPDYERGSVAIQTTELGSLSRTAASYDVSNSASAGSLYSMGDFVSPTPDGDDVCSAPSLSTTHLVLDEVPAIEDDPATEDDESFPGQPAQDITLEWSDVKIVVSAALFGTQMQADLTDTRVAPDGATCTIKYRALGLTPAVPCFKSDEDGNPLMKDDTHYETDPALCDPEANPDEGRYAGSGISPLSAIECDDVTGFCLLTGETVPAYN